MKLTLGLLATTACALALAGCNSSGHRGLAANAGAIVGAANVDVTGNTITSVNLTSNATTDPTTKVKFAYDTNGTSNPVDDSATVTVTDGGQTAGPTTFAYDRTSPVGTNGLVAQNPGYGAFYVYSPTKPPAGGDNSILVAGDSPDSFAGVIAAYDPNNKTGSADLTTNNANVTAFYGGNAPSGTLPTGTVTYTGTAVGAAQTTGGSLAPVNGTASLTANFTGGTVGGTLLSGANAVTFTGATMSTNSATYSLSDTAGAGAITVGGANGTGQVNGGFYGPEYNQTAGAFDVQTGTGPGGTKITGAFGATAH